MSKQSLQALSFVVTAVIAATSANAQNIPVALNYNFNGIVHAGESGLPDALGGYRSISDRGLDFTGGVPSDPLLNPYQLIPSAGLLDIVHLGNRNTVDNGSKAFQPAVNGDDTGVQPTWLFNVDQSGPQTTVMLSPLPIAPTTSIAFLYQISNGGGSFDVTLSFLSGTSHTATLSGGDWFGGPFFGTANIDNGFASNNLSITEGRINMSAFSGEVVTDITFENGSNINAGYAILACNFEYPPEPSRVNQIALNYNFNGIAHAGETGMPDDLLGYRSISDRGLDFTAGVPVDPLLAPYSLVDQPFTVDIVHLGNRDTVNNSGQIFDTIADGDDFGVIPLWLPIVDQTTPQLTPLTNAIVMDSTSSARVLFQISNGGGSFDVEFQFQTGAPVIATVNGPDWFGGVLAGVAGVDSAIAGANLSLTERTVDLSAEAGRTLVGIAFQNATNTNAGLAVVAMNVIGCASCANGSTASIVNLGGGTSGQMNSTSTGGLGCDLNWQVSGAVPNSFGVFAVGLGTTSLPLNVVIPGCPGTIHTPSPVLATAPLDTFGAGSLTLETPMTQALCGQTATGQYVSLQLGACFLVLSDAIAITIGN
ncbi:MAG: hypothetical protein ACJA0V_002341 [Planctomycetota bacterium]|jgi:hypothetical protein